MRKQDAVMPMERQAAGTFVLRPEIVRIKRLLRTRAVAAGTQSSSNRCLMARALLPLLEAILDELQFYDLTLPDISYLFNLETTHCSANFARIGGKPFCQWRREIRNRAARTLLRATSLPITEIATRVGYAEITRFDKNFLLEVGICPGQYRKLRGVSVTPPARRRPGRRGSLLTIVSTCIRSSGASPTSLRCTHRMPGHLLYSARLLGHIFLRAQAESLAGRS
jgi:AraC-like DNA-binding protein